MFSRKKDNCQQQFYVPCSLERPSVPWRRAEWFSRRYLGGQRRLRPGVKCQPPSINTNVSSTTYHSEVLEWAGVLDVLQGLLQILELHVDSALGLLGVLDGLGLEGLNGLDLARDVVGSRLERLEVVLYGVDDGLVLESRAVVAEVHSGWRLGQLLELAAGIFVALLEGVEGGDGLAAEPKARGDCLPVKLESCATLLVMLSACCSSIDLRVRKKLIGPQRMPQRLLPEPENLL